MSCRDNVTKRPLLWAGDAPGGRYADLVLQAYRDGTIPAGTLVFSHYDSDAIHPSDGDTVAEIDAARRAAEVVPIGGAKLWVCVVHGSGCAVFNATPTPCNCEPELLVADLSEFRKAGAA